MSRRQVVSGHPHIRTPKKARKDARSVDQMTQRNKEKGADSPPPRVGPLDSAAGVLREMARVYRAARGGKLGVEVACKYTYMLQAMGRLYETVELERRVQSLEEVRSRPLMEAQSESRITH